MPARVVVTDFLTDSLEPEQRVLGDLAELTALNAHSEAELVGQVETADVLLLYHNLSLTAATINRLDRCKLIVRCGVGYDNVDHALARQRGIPVVNIPDYGTEEVADSAIALMLSLVRGVNLYNNRLQRNAGPWSYTQAAPLLRLRGRVFGVIGLGRIGTAAALRAKSLGMKVSFYDPYLPDGVEKALGLTRVETREALLRESFVVSLHTPLTPATKHLIGSKELQLMPRGSYLVNTARGACVDWAAIPEAIASGQLAGAGLDVLPEEPPQADHPLIRAWRDPNHPCHDRVIINPHAAFYSEEGLLDIRIKSAEAARRVLLGLPLRNVVN